LVFRIKKSLISVVSIFFKHFIPLKEKQMKKILLTLAGAMSIAAAANAQLADGSVFPDFTRTDINGNVHHLYADLDAGKTVFIDVSATWCAPCWGYHTSGKLDSLWAKHGPTGQPGVDAATTNDVVVYFVQGETGSGLAELTNNTWGTGAQTTTFNHTNFTQGNWVAGSNYYIIDDSTAQGSYNTAWNITYFPTVYMICRDRLVYTLTQPTEAAAYAAAQATCPAYAPSSTVDAKAAPYAGADYFVCNAAPSIKFQNYSTTTPITAATITVKDGAGATVATVPWSGSLAPYAVATVSIPSFAGTSFGGYKYSVSVTGDSYPANDVSIDSVFKIYGAANAGSIPYSDDLMGAITYKYGFPSDHSVGLPNPAWTGAPNPSGVTTNKYLLFDFYDFQANQGSFDFVVGNFNTTGATALKFEFDQAYALYTGNASDKMYVKVSTNCGATWTTVWTGVDATLTTAASTTSAYVPASASDWQHRTVDLSAYANANLMVKFAGTSAYGNYAWVTNLKLRNATAVQSVPVATEMTIAPNPATDVANLFLNMTSRSDVQVQIIDAMGRVVSSNNYELNSGAQTVSLSTSSLATGIYSVKVLANGAVTVKQLSVTK
jgi:hypothetical protein